MVRRLALIALPLAALAVAAPATSADPSPDNNKNAVVRTFNCTNGANDLAVVFAGDNGSNFNVVNTQSVSGQGVSTQSVFVYKQIVIDRLPLGPGGNDETTDRGIQAFDPASLTTCDYTNPSGTHVTVTGFFSPRH
jgi:hypothetical protein